MEIFNKIKNKILSKSQIIVFIGILLISIFSRGYRLEELPVGIHVDEAGMAYDAFCLANNGTDRFLNHLPVYLENFGGGQSALYAYLASIFVKIFGLNMVSIRLPAFLMSIAVIITIYFTTKKECGIKTAQAFTFFVAICPWHIMSSRWGLDCNLLAPMIIISTCILINSKKVKDYIITGIFFGLTLYTYALSYLILPVFLALILIYMLYTKKIKFKMLFPLGIPIFLFAIPLMLMLLINNGFLEQIEGVITINKLPDYRGVEISFSNIKENLKFIKTIFTNDGLTYNALPEYGTVYNFSIFLIILGGLIELNNFILNIKNKKFEFNSIMFLLVGTVFSCSLLIFEPNINRVNAIYIPMMFFIVSAMKLFYKNYKIIFYIFMIIFIIYFVKFEHFYFCNYEKIYGVQKYFEKDYLEVLKYVNEKDELKNREIHVFTSTAEPYIYTLINNKISPQEFISGLNQECLDDDLYCYNNYYFRNLDVEDEDLCIVNSKEDNDIYLLLKNIGFIEDEYSLDKEYKILYKVK